MRREHRPPQGIPREGSTGFFKKAISCAASAAMVVAFAPTVTMPAVAWADDEGSDPTAPGATITGNDGTQYVIVDYIESNGTQIVKTDIDATSLYETDITYQVINSETTNVIAGVGEDGNTAARYLPAAYSSGKKMRIAYGNSEKIYSSDTDNPKYKVSYIPTGTSTVAIENGTLSNASGMTIGSESKNATVSFGATSSYNPTFYKNGRTTGAKIYLFGANYGDADGNTNGSYRTSTRIYSFATKTDENTINANYVPVLNKSTNTAGFYDTVSSKFVTDANGKDLAYSISGHDYTVGTIADQELVGSNACEPDVTVSNRTSTLTKDTDYSISCENNDKPGIATATVSIHDTVFGERTYKVPFLIKSPAQDSALPKDYTAAGAIQSTGSQWIDTDIVPTADTLLELTYKIVAPSNLSIVCGARKQSEADNTNNKTTTIVAANNNESNGKITSARWRLGAENGFGTAIYGAAGVDFPKTTVAMQPRYGVKVSSDVDIIPPVGATATVSTNGDSPKSYFVENSEEWSAPDRSLYLFAGNYGASTAKGNWCSSALIYSFKATDGKTGRVLANYVPATDSEGKAGFYDTVSKEFKTNEGFGNLSAVNGNAISGANFSVEDIADQTLGAAPVEPDVTVKNGNTTLKRGVDYTVSYKDNDKVGTAAKAIISLQGSYYGTLEKTFNIVAPTGGALPSGYIKLDYLESDGTQYIDTGISATAVDPALGVTQAGSVELKYQVVKKDKTNVIAGVNNLKDSSANGRFLVAAYAGGETLADKMRLTYGSKDVTYRDSPAYGVSFITYDVKYVPGGESTVTPIGAGDSQALKLDTTGATRSFDNDETNKSYKNASIYLFAANYGGANYYSSARIYSFSAKDGSDSAIANFVPAYNTYTKKLGMYDTVKGEFHMNARKSGAHEFGFGCTAASYTVELSGDTTYTGNEIEPQVTVKSGSDTVSSNSYTVEYRSNVNAGTATARIVMKDCSAIIDKTFEITKAAAEVDGAVTTSRMVYTGDPLAGSLVKGTVKSNGADVTSKGSWSFDEGADKTVTVGSHNVTWKSANYNDVHATVKIARVGESKLLYKFGAISDIHQYYVNNDSAKAGPYNATLTQVLKKLKEQGASFVTASGDIGNSAITSGSANENDMKALKASYDAANVSDLPMYACGGNHDVKQTDEIWKYVNALGRDSLPEGTVTVCPDNAKTYSAAINNDLFLFVSLESEYKDCYTKSIPWAIEQLETKENANKRVFVIIHYPLQIGVAGLMKGETFGFGANGSADRNQAAALVEAMKKHGNTVSFTGHTHHPFELAETLGDDFNFHKIGGSSALANASVSAYKIKNSTSEQPWITDTPSGQGSMVEVYDNRIIVRTMDLINKSGNGQVYLPYAYTLMTDLSYGVTLNVNGGTIADGENVISYKSGTGVAKLPIPTRMGYTFAGWYASESFEGEAVTSIGRDEVGDKTLYAKWTRNSTGGGTYVPTPTPKPDPTPTPDPDQPQAPAKGDVVTTGTGAGQLSFAVTNVASASGKGGTVSFAGCNGSATSVDVPSAVEVGGVAYAVTEIAPYAFKGAPGLEKVTMPGTIAKVGKGAFESCKRLESFTIGTGVKSIGKSAFKGCKRLTSVTVTSKHLSKKAVKGCLKGSAVKTVVVKVGSAKANKSYAKKYAKLFTKKVAGKKATVKASKKALKK